MNLKQYKDKLLRDPEFAREYHKLDLPMEISLMVEEARMLAGITQAELAKKVRTKQPSIARLENGKYLPSLSFLQKIAKALGTYLIPPTMGVIEEFNRYFVDTGVGKVETKTTELISMNGFEDFSPAYLLNHNMSSVGTNNLLN